tara:strand:+ start:1128 stop:1784 length:657 start_codon:yes stop_codon:yes gene_type:complete
MSNVKVSTENLDKKYLLKLINKERPVIFDIGCYDAKDSLEFMAIKNNVKVYAFDPNPKITAPFKHQLEANKNFSLIETALGNVNGEVEWYKSSNHPASDSMKIFIDPLKVFKDIKFNKADPVKCFRLDSWAKDNLREEVIDLMWVDVNGAEKEFLEGAMETISTKTKFIFIEFNAVGKQKLYKECYTREEILGDLNDFEELGVYDFKGNFGNLLLRKK